MSFKLKDSNNFKMTDRKLVNFEKEKFQTLTKNSEIWKQDEQARQSEKFPESHANRHDILNNIIKIKETSNPSQVEVAPDQSRRNPIHYKNKFVFTEFTKHPEENIEGTQASIKAKIENYDGKISNVGNQSVPYGPLSNQSKSDERSPTLTLGSRNSQEKNLSFNSPNILQESPGHFSEDSKEVKPHEKLLPTNIEQQDEEETTEKFNHGRWTKEEQIRFIEALWLYGNEWKKVQLHISTRSSSQSRSHAQKFFLKLKKKFTTYLMISGIESIGEENFPRIIEWIKESIGTKKFFLDSNKVFYFKLIYY